MSTTAELKAKVIKRIEQIDEDYLLEDLLNLIDFETSDEVLKIPDAHKESIEIGLAQIKAGQTYSNEEVMERVKQWAGK